MNYGIIDDENKYSLAVNFSDYLLLLLKPDQLTVIEEDKIQFKEAFGFGIAYKF